MNSEGRALFVVVQCAFGLCTNEKSIPLRRFAVLHFIQFCRADGAMPAEPILLRNQPTQPSTLASRVRSLLYDVAWCDALHCFTQYLLGLLGGSCGCSCPSDSKCELWDHLFVESIFCQSRHWYHQSVSGLLQYIQYILQNPTSFSSKPAPSASPHWRLSGELAVQAS